MICDFPQEWAPCVTVSNDEPSRLAYIQSLYQCIEQSEQCMAESAAARQYECCSYRWWLMPEDGEPSVCFHCGQPPRLVPADEALGYGMFECPRCRWTWVSHQPHCRRGVTQSACVQCESPLATLVSVGPLSARNAFLDWHWARRHVRRATGQTYAPAAEYVPVTRTCPVCAHRAPYNNPLARRCCHCHRRVFAGSAGLLPG